MNFNGYRVNFNKFAYTNKHGGTPYAGIKNQIVTPKIVIEEKISGIIVHHFHDYECGERFHVKLDKKFWDMIKHDTKENKVYVSEFDMVD